MSPQPGWYPDPASNGHNRYWNGHAWTDMTVPAAVHRPDVPYYAPPAETSIPTVNTAELAAEMFTPAPDANPIPSPATMSTTNSQPFYNPYLNTRPKNRVGMILGIIVGVLSFMIVSVIAVLSLYLLLPSTTNEPLPTANPTEVAQDNPPVDFSQGYSMPSGTTAIWTVPSYWELTDETPTSSSYRTRTCDIKTFNGKLTFEVPADIKTDEELAAKMLNDTTHTETATILNEAYSVDLNVEGGKNIILLATPWNMEISSTVNGYPNPNSTIYGVDAVHTSIKNKTNIGIQVGCEVETDVEAVFNELKTQGYVTVG